MKITKGNGRQEEFGFPVSSLCFCLKSGAPHFLSSNPTKKSHAFIFKAFIAVISQSVCIWMWIWYCNLCCSLYGHKTEEQIFCPGLSCLPSADITAHERWKRGICLVPASLGAYFVGIWKLCWSWIERNSTLPKYTQHKLFLPCDQSENQNHFILPSAVTVLGGKTHCSFVSVSHTLCGWHSKSDLNSLSGLHCAFQQLSFLLFFH